MKKQDLKDVVTYIGPLVILIGSFKVYVYYSLFDIDVFQYIELTELFTLTYKDLVLFILMTAFLNLIIFIIQPKNEIEYISDSINNTLDESNIIKRLIVYGRDAGNYIIFLIVMVLYLPVFIFYSDRPFEEYIKHFLIGTSIYLTIFFVFEIRRKYYIIYKEYPKIIYTKIALVIMIISISSILGSYSEFQSVKFSKKNYGTQVMLFDNIIVSDSNYYYIGKSKNYIFFHNDCDSTNQIFPMSEVKMISSP